jgi:hypothetical protein
MKILYLVFISIFSVSVNAGYVSAKKMGVTLQSQYGWENRRPRTTSVSFFKPSDSGVCATAKLSIVTAYNDQYWVNLLAQGGFEVEGDVVPVEYYLDMESEGVLSKMLASSKLKDGGVLSSKWYLFSLESTGKQYLYQVDSLGLCEERVFWEAIDILLSLEVVM